MKIFARAPVRQFPIGLGLGGLAAVQDLLSRDSDLTTTGGYSPVDNI